MHIPSVITIDGPAGAGKSTLGQRLASRLGYLFFDTGVLYRALTWAALRDQLDLYDHEALANLAETLDIEIQTPAASLQDGRQYTVLVDQQDITWQLRQPDIEANVSLVSRHRVTELQARGRVVDYPTIHEEIAQRDALDHHVMAPAPDALMISSDGYTPDEIAELVLEMWKK